MHDVIAWNQVNTDEPIAIVTRDAYERRGKWSTYRGQYRVTLMRVHGGKGDLFRVHSLEVLKTGVKVRDRVDFRPWYVDELYLGKIVIWRGHRCEKYCGSDLHTPSL